MDDGYKEEKRALRRTYDAKAVTFSRSRSEPWSEVAEYLEELAGDGGGHPDSGVALDLACGNGRHLGLLTERYAVAVGVDFSRPMLELARREAPAAEVCRGDLEALPLCTGVADLALYVAGLHHLPSAEARARSLRELDRALAPRGRALLSVWAIEHPEFDGRRGEIRGQRGDVHVSLGGRERYYHVYEMEELRGALESSPLALESLELSGGNYYARLRSE